MKLLSNFKRIIHPSNYGWLEIILAFYLILIRYKPAGIPLNFVLAIILSAIAIKRGVSNKYIGCTTMILMIFYVLLHDIIWIELAPYIPDTFVNGYISTALLLFSVILIAPAINYSKFRNSLQLVAVMSVIGLFYHVYLFAKGVNITPLDILPFDTPREYERSLRPLSFYAEPQMYVSFMIVPFFLSLVEKKYIWSSIIFFSLLASTSTTGFVVAFVTAGLYLLTQHFNFKSIVFVAILSVIGYIAISNLQVFEYGIEKIENTDSEKSTRLSNGPDIVKTMEPSEYIFGVPYINAFQYCQAHNITFNGVDNNVYLPTFWYMLLRFGLLGLLLYLALFIRAYGYDKTLLPFIASYCATMFSNPDSLGSTYVFTCLFILSYINRGKFNQHMCKSQY